MARGALLALIGCAIGTVTLAQMASPPPAGSDPAARSAPARPIGDFARAVQVAEPGCNATAFAQLPNQPTLFIGRQLVSAQGGLAGFSAPNDCSGGVAANESQGKPFNRWGLTLNRFDWNTRTFTLVNPLLDTSLDARTGRSRATITGGAMRGAIVRSAYDPSVVRFGGLDIVAFECTIEDERAHGVTGTSSCVSVYDRKTRTLDMRRTTVLVSGSRSGQVDHVAAVPRLLAFGGRLYLYWSALAVRYGRVEVAAQRGVELAIVRDNVGIKERPGAFIAATDPRSVEVWAPTRDPMGNTLVNVFALVPRGNAFTAYAALGGSGCGAPSDRARGCFRLAVIESDTPLARHGWNRARRVAAALPTNPQEYTTLIRDPEGREWLLGHFVKPPANGYSERDPAPSARFWQARRSDSALIMFPAE